MDLEIVSRETIRPSSPTPSHLRIFPLSHLDQFSPPFYVPLLYFYPMSDTNSNNVNQILHKLKLSLSETLSVFYPLAGRIKDHISIDCNDEGVMFSEAKANGHLSEILKQPKLELLDQFLPSVDISRESLNLAVQLAIQVNIFTCGGISIGFRFLHRVIDATTIKAFLGCWAAITSGSNDKATISLDISTASLFPPSESMDDQMVCPFDLTWLTKKEKGIQRIFVFDAEAISGLKAKVVSEATPNPTRFQVVASFIWKCAMSASRALGSQNPSMIMIPVNLRPKMEPSMSKNSIGNTLWSAMAHHGKEEMELRSVVDILRGALQKINGDLITSLQSNQGVVVMSRVEEELTEIYSNETPDVYSCSSWCGLGFYDVNFGWGKPIWIVYLEGDTSNKPFYPNAIVLMDTISGDGIEASMLLAESHMKKLQGDKEFLTFATLKSGISIN